MLQGAKGCYKLLNDATLLQVRQWDTDHRSYLTSWEREMVGKEL